jgi:hypothetical protein
MKVKRKFMAIFLILLLIIPLGIVQAGVNNEKYEDKNTISVQLTSLDLDENQKTEIVYLSEEELIEFEETITNLIDKIEASESWEEVQGIIDNFLKGNNLGIFNTIKNLLFKFLPFRTYIISSGRGFKLNPFKKGSTKIRKSLSFWHYSSGKLFKDRTVIIKPLSLKLKILKGLQAGIMTGFKGIFIYVARRFPQKSYTFFMGMTRRVYGIQMPFGK